MPGSGKLATTMRSVKSPALVAVLFLLVSPGAGIRAQEEPQDEKIAMRSDADWTELVVVLRSGKRVTYARSDVLNVEYVTSRTGGGSGSTAVSARLVGGQLLDCSARAGEKTWPCKVRITSFDRSSGAIVGELTWSTLSSVHRIRGKLAGNSLSFTETEAIRAGGAHLNVEYTLTIAGGAVSGSWVDRSDHDARGTFAIKVP